MVNSFYNMRMGTGRQVPFEAIDSMQVYVSNAPAESGEAMGGAIVAGTRSGGNQYHASVYDYLRNASWAAPDKYASGWKPNGRQNQGGATAGLPILRNRLFLFASAEIVSGRSEGLNLITNPLIGDSTGLHIPAANCTASAAQCAAVAKLIQSKMGVIVLRSDRSVSGVAKVDFHLNRMFTITAEGGGMNWKAPNGLRPATVSTNNGLLGDNGDLWETRRYARLAVTTSLGSSFINEAHVNWTKDHVFEAPSAQTWPITGPVSMIVAGTQLGTPPDIPNDLKEERRQITDTANWTSGTHSVKFGVGLLKTRDTILQLANAFGTYTYPTLTAFAYDFSGITVLRKNYTSFTQSLGDRNRSFTPSVFNVFAQDTWRILPGLTFDLGLRWERPPDAAAELGEHKLLYQTGIIPSPGLNFSPRAGLAYTPDSNTILRAGFGFYYSPYPGELINSLFLGGQTKITANPAQTGAPIYPNVLPGNVTVTGGLENLIYATGKLRNPYNQELTASVERRLSKTASLTLSGVRARGLKLWSTEDQNLLDPTKTQTFTINDASGKPTTQKYTTPYWTAKSDPRYAHLYQIDNLASSWYTAVTAQLNVRMTHGVAAQFSYAWSHNVDNVGGGALPGAPGAYLANTDIGQDKGAAAIDQRHRVTASWTWAPTVKSGSPAPLRLLVNGWEVSGMFTGASALPATGQIFVSGQQFSGTNPAYWSSLNGSGGWDRVPFWPVNSLRGDKQYDVDARVSRSFSFGERLKLRVLCEAYNALNRQWNTGLNTIAYVAYSGVLKPVAGVGTGNSAAAYPDGTNARRVQVSARISF